MTSSHPQPAASSVKNPLNWLLAVALGGAVTLGALIGAGVCQGTRPGPVTLEEMRGSGDEAWNKPGVPEKTGEMIDSLGAERDGGSSGDEGGAP